MYQGEDTQRDRSQPNSSLETKQSHLGNVALQERKLAFLTHGVQNSSLLGRYFSSHAETRTSPVHQTNTIILCVQRRVQKVTPKALDFCNISPIFCYLIVRFSAPCALF